MPCTFGDDEVSASRAPPLTAGCYAVRGYGAGEDGAASTSLGSIVGSGSSSLQARDALIRGEWVVVQRGCDMAGNVLLMARRSSRLGNPASLSTRERMVAVAAAAGVSAKVIGIELCLTSSTVSEHLSRAMRKLHLVSRRELAALLFHREGSDSGVDGSLRGRQPEGDRDFTNLRVCSFDVDGDRYLLFAIDPRPRLRLGSLTPAERSIVGLVIAGATNTEIADARRTKPQTVANQLRQVFDKLAVSSRAHLIAACIAA